MPLEQAEAEAKAENAARLEGFNKGLSCVFKFGKERQRFEWIKADDICAMPLFARMFFSEIVRICKNMLLGNVE